MVESPKQTLAVAIVVNKRGGFIVTVESAEEEHPDVVPVTIYVVLEPGVASAVFTPVGIAPALQV